MQVYVKYLTLDQLFYFVSLKFGNYLNKAKLLGSYELLKESYVVILLLLYYVWIVSYYVFLLYRQGNVKKNTLTEEILVPRQFANWKIQNEFAWKCDAIIVFQY